MENPLLHVHELSNDQFIPFDKITSEHFEPAFEIAFANARKNLQVIIDNAEEPSFSNTIEAIETCSEQLDGIIYIFNNLKEADTNSEIDRIAKIVLPQVAEWGNDLSLNELLFKRVKSVYDAKPVLQTKEQERLLETTYRFFVRNGALLDEKGKKQLREYDQTLESLSQKFGENLLKATNAYQLVIDNENDLTGLPARVIETAKEEAVKENKQDSWIFTLKAPSVGPFMQYADNETLRKEISIASGSRAMAGESNNQEIVLEIVDLRDKRAKLLGYKSHAHFVLENRMAKTPENVYSFFKTLYDTAQPKAKEDFEMLRTYKEKTTGNPILESWDVSYFSEKIRQEKYNFNEEEFRSYFEINNVISSVFENAGLLYGLTFKKRNDIPLYHSDVLVFEVNDENGGSIGILYFDLFPRDSKRNGAWIEALRTQHIRSGVDIRPHMLIVCNLTKPTDTLPSLLNMFEVETIFHEFGHALHSLLSKCTYASLAGFNTLWDFVELPSQFMDTFTTDEKSLKISGKHFQTGEVVPDQLIQKKINSEKFMVGWQVLSQLGAAFLDMKWHDGSAQGAKSVGGFEDITRKDYRLFEQYPGTSISTSFKHIFNGGYDAGYYSYHWAEVLSSDAFEYFKENGLFSKEIANKFRENILSKGNTEEPMVLYKKFRGREPDPNALLRLKGLL